MRVSARKVDMVDEDDTDRTRPAQQTGAVILALPPGRESRDRQARRAVFDEWSRNRPMVALPPIPTAVRR